MPKTRHARHAWKPRFLAAFEEDLTVTAACQRAGVSRSAVYEARQRDEGFALAWHHVESRIVDTLEREAYRRAVEGVERPVYQRGVQVGSVREYSDRLLEMLLKARAPERYRENSKVEVSGHDGGPVTLADLAALVDNPSRRHSAG